MTITVAMYERSHAHIRERLDKLGLTDVRFATFDRSGMFTVGGAKIAAEQMDVDYLWLSVDINLDGVRKEAFDTVLRCKSVKVLQTFNAGLDDPVYKKIAARGTRICNSSAQGIAIAEYSIGQVLAVLQPVAQQREQQSQRVWKQTPFRELSQTNWLIIGFGPIGQELAKRVTAFGAGVSVIRRSPAASPYAARVATMADLNAYARDADVIVLACSLTAETRGFANAAFFKAVKPGAILVNVARGGLVDDAAMVAALDGGQLSTAILDVFHEEPLPPANPLWSHPKVHLTPHTSFAGSGVRSRWDRLFLDNITRFTRGEALANEVNAKDI